MYTPSAFSVADASVVREFLLAHSFGILVSADRAVLHDTHTPFLVSDDLRHLEGHIARANPQWKSWEQDPRVKVIFHGPHAYVSPRFYVSEFNVPTWNYSAVSIDGRIRVIQDPGECLELIQRLILQHEGPSGWKLDVDDARYRKLFDAIVCFTIEIDHIEAKFKLNQNKSTEDRQSAMAHLRDSHAPLDRQTAELMARLVG